MTKLVSSFNIHAFLCVRAHAFRGIRINWYAYFIEMWRNTFCLFITQGPGGLGITTVPVVWLTSTATSVISLHGWLARFVESNRIRPLHWHARRVPALKGWKAVVSLLWFPLLYYTAMPTACRGAHTKSSVCECQGGEKRDRNGLGVYSRSMSNPNTDTLNTKTHDWTDGEKTPQSQLLFFLRVDISVMLQH